MFKIAVERCLATGDKNLVTGLLKPSVFLILIALLVSFDALCQEDLEKVFTRNTQPDSVKNRFAETTAGVRDSIQSILNTPNLLTQQVKAKAQYQLDSLNKLLGFDKIKGVTRSIQDSLDAITNKVQSGISDLNTQTEKIESRLQPITGNVAPNLNVSEKSPSLDIHQADKINTNLLNSPNLDLPVSTDTKIPSPNFETPDLDVTKTIGEKLPAKDISKITDGVNNVEQKLETTKKYEDDLTKIKEVGLQNSEELPREIESRIGERDEIKVLNAEVGKIREQQTAIQKYKDQKLMKEELLRNVKQVATDRLNKFSPEFTQAQKQISKARKLNPSVKSVKEIAKKRPNQMAGKPFRQRFIPGVTVQAFTNNKVTTDLGVHAAYRISGRLTSGVGYVYRLSFSRENVNFVGDEGVSGYRTFFQFGIKKGIFAHGDFDALKISKEKLGLKNEDFSERVYGGNFGMGKKFSLSKTCKGSIIGLYRVNYKGELPMASKVSVRMTFDLSLKKKSKPNFRIASRVNVSE